MELILNSFSLFAFMSGRFSTGVFGKAFCDRKKNTTTAQRNKRRNAAWRDSCCDMDISEELTSSAHEIGGSKST